MLNQASPQTSAGIESTEVAEIGTAPKTGIGTRSETEVKTVIGGMGTGPLPEITGVTSLAGTEMNVITGRLRAERGLEKTLEIGTGKISEAKKPSKGLGLKKFCQDLLLPGMSSSVQSMAHCVCELESARSYMWEGLLQLLACCGLGLAWLGAASVFQSLSPCSSVHSQQASPACVCCVAHPS